MAKKLKQGEKYPEGFTQSQILLKLCGKDITPTSEIIDFLKDQFGISEQKNIREHHLKTLEKKKLIKRESAGKGKTDYWYVKNPDSVTDDAATFAQLLNRFVGTEYEEEFLKSSYVSDRPCLMNSDIDAAVVNTIYDKLKTVQLLCNTFYPYLPLTHALTTVLAPGTSDDVAEKLAEQREQQLLDLFRALIDAWKPRVDVATRKRLMQTPVEQMTNADRLIHRAINREHRQQQMRATLRWMIGRL